MKLVILILLSIVILILVIIQISHQAVGIQAVEEANFNKKNNYIYVYVKNDRIIAQHYGGSIIVEGDAENGAYNVIRAAVDDLKLLNGGTLYIKKGVYNATGKNIELPSNIQVEGDGEMTVINDMGFYIHSESNISIKNISFIGDADYAIMIREGSDKIILNNVTAKLSSNAWGAFIQYTENGIISNTSFINCRAIDNGGFGFLNDGSGHIKLITNSSYINCKAIRCGYFERYNDWTTGFDIAENCNVENVKLVDCIAEQNWESGFHLENRPSKFNVEFINCSSSYNGLSKSDPSFGAGFLVSSGVNLNGCKAFHNIIGYRLSVNREIGMSFNECEASDNKIGYLLSINKSANISLTNCTDLGSMDAMILYNEAGKMQIKNIFVN